MSLQIDWIASSIGSPRQSPEWRPTAAIDKLTFFARNGLVWKTAASTISDLRQRRTMDQRARVVSLLVSLMIKGREAFRWIAVSATIQPSHHSTRYVNDMKLAAVLIGIVSLSPLYACKTDGTPDYLAVIRANFPDYWLREQSSQIQPTHNDDILIGDFNSDGIQDFAAVLIRKILPSELQRLPERHRNEVTIVGLAVACNGVVDANDRTGYECSEIAGPKIGGIFSELQYREWSEQLHGWSGFQGNPEQSAACDAALKQRVGTNSLSLIETIGHCDTYFYPSNDSSYVSCMYCSD